MYRESAYVSHAQECFFDGFVSLIGVFDTASDALEDEAEDELDRAEDRADQKADEVADLERRT